MFAKLLLVLAAVCVSIAHAGLPAFGPITAGTSTVKSDVKAGQTGLDGLNLQLNAPFKIDDYVVGFRMALKSVLSSKTPLPDSVFLKKSVATPSPLDGTATVDTSVDLATKVLSADATWSAKETDLSLTASANSVDRVTDVGISTRAKIGPTKTGISANFNILKHKLAAALKVDYADTSAQVTYDTVAKDPVVKIVQKIDGSNSVSPVVSLKTLAQSYGWTRVLPSGGTLETTLHLHDKVAVTWKDRGTNGLWTTKLDVPLEDTRKAKVSIGHEFSY